MTKRFITLSEVSGENQLNGEFNEEGIKIGNKVSYYEKPKIIVGETLKLPDYYHSMPKTHWQWLDFSASADNRYIEFHSDNFRPSEDKLPINGSLNASYEVSESNIGGVNSRIKRVLYYCAEKNAVLDFGTNENFTVKKLDDSIYAGNFLTSAPYSIFLYIDENFSQLDAIVWYDKNELVELPRVEKNYENPWVFDPEDLIPSLYSIDENKNITWLTNTRFFKLLEGIDLTEEL